MRLCMEKKMRVYQNHLQSGEDLITTYEATRAGFVMLALEKNYRSSPYIAEARVLQQLASYAKSANDLIGMKDIEIGLLTAAGLSNKALNYLSPSDKVEAVRELIKNFLEPAGDKFIEELVFRFLLTRGDALGGSMRNVAGILAQRKFTRTVISTLTIMGKNYRWLHSKSKRWINMTRNDVGIEMSLRGLNWQNGKEERTLIYNLTVPLVKNNVDICFFNAAPFEIEKDNYQIPESYIALGELKGGIDPAGADEHWKTARTSLERITSAFSKINLHPYTLFVGAAIERKMSREIWERLESGLLDNAANLNNENQIASIAYWMCGL